MNWDKDAPVGIFDSGVGGISVLREAVRLLPRERFLYYGDTAYAPYGTKTPQQVLQRVQEVVDLLLVRGIKALVIACNTATGVAAQALRDRLDIPVIGIEPALKPASLLRHGGCVLVMATPVTLSQEKFLSLMARYGEGAVALPCPGLMEFVERGETDSPALEDYLQRLFQPFRARQVDSVVLGCTHYAFLREQIARHFPAGTVLVDGNEGTVRQLRRRLEETGLLRDAGEGSVTLETSCDLPEVIEQMRRLLWM